MRERSCHAFARVPGRFHACDRPIGKVGGRERRLELGDGAIDAGVERQRRNGKLASALRRIQFDGLRLKGGVQHRDRMDFVPIVVLGVHPEHGHCPDAVLSRRRGARAEWR